MNSANSERTYKYFNKYIHRIGERCKQITLPGLQNVPVYDAFWFFIRGVKKGSLSTRASSIAFYFLLAIGPGIIFMFTLIPYIPIPNLNNETLALFKEIMPLSAYDMIDETIADLFRKRGGLQLFGLLTALFFATRGVLAMINAFNATYHTIEQRSWLNKNLTALLLVIIFTILLTISVSLIIFNKVFVDLLIQNNIFEINFQFYLLLISKWLIVILFIFLSISTLFYLAPFKKTGWRFINAGSTLATILTIMASLGFSYFVNNFAQFNKFFGSIGALMALMLWMNFNALTLLIGFELNASLNNAQLSDE